MSMMNGFDYLALAYQYGINDQKIAKDLYQNAMNITRKLAGNVPQNKLESEFPKELMDNYQDLLQLQKKGKYKESANKQKENNNMKNTTKIREYLENGMDLEKLIKEFDLKEEESYSQSMINPKTTDFKDDEDEMDEGCKGKKKKEYAFDNGRPNTGDLDGENAYGTGYADDGENAYGTDDDKQFILDAETVFDNQDELSNGEGE